MNRSPRGAALALLTTLVLGLIAAPLAAQVGRPPSTSPFRDISSDLTLTPFGGYTWGSGGTLGLGPQNGPVAGVRMDIRVSAPLTLGVQLSYGDYKRNYIDLKDTTGSALRGPTNTHLIQVEFGAQVNLTGKKAWHGIAPFIGVMGGLGFASGSSVDSSGYKFGTKFVFAPMFGTRVVIANGFMFRAEMRWNFWQLKYPTTYTVSTPSGEVLLGQNLSEWTGTPSLTAGFSFGL
ncbi:MAG TPA: hypothetical protein VJN95_18325 [Gemmatimonadales bacterium]|nr:hypothetical protein [Gemmatimonadales bacterium]